MFSLSNLCQLPRCSILLLFNAVVEDRGQPWKCLTSQVVWMKKFRNAFNTCADQFLGTVSCYLAGSFSYYWDRKMATFVNLKKHYRVFLLFFICQVLGPRPWTSGSSWSSCLSSAAARSTLSRSQVRTGATGPMAQQTAEERSARRAWLSCWLGLLGLTKLWPSWRTVVFNWSFHPTPNWSVRCWESLRRGKGGSGYQMFRISKQQDRLFMYC